MIPHYGDGQNKALFCIAVEVSITDKKGVKHQEKIMVDGVKAYKKDSLPAKTKAVGAQILGRKKESFIDITSEMDYTYVVKTSPKKPLSCRPGCGHIIVSQGLSQLNQRQLLDIVRGVLDGTYEGSYVAGYGIGHVEAQIRQEIDYNSDMDRLLPYKDKRHLDGGYFPSKEDTTWVDRGSVNQN